MLLLITSFLAGILTVFAPCVLILLPVIVGSSLTTDTDKKADHFKPYIISISLGFSVLLFTLLLKASTVLINVDPQVWKSISGGIVIILGLSLLFPLMWATLSARVGLESGTNTLLAKTSKKSGIAGYILTGAALGPVFSACSPIYALILATILPVNLGLGLVYMTLYATGLSLALLAIALGGRRLTKRLKWTAQPNGWFRRSLAILLIVVGVAIITGVDKRIQTWILVHIPISSTQLEEKLVPNNKTDLSTNIQGGKKTMFNVENPYAAPELKGIQDWINSDPVTLASLKGKVVLIDFWTYSCINCQRTQPYLNKWYDKYRNDGFVIIGAHAPEFAFEKIPENVRQAVTEAKIKYPVALDNDFATWNAYKNEFWPAKYLIDKDGQVRYTHNGEGDYDETERAIQALLKESGHKITDSIDKNNTTVPVQNGQTPETYLGYERGERFANASQYKQDKTVSYVLTDKLQENEWSLGGDWKIGAKESVAVSETSLLRVKYSAKEAYLVMNGPNDKPVTLELNGQKVTQVVNGGSDVNPNGQVHLEGARLYRLIKSSQFTKNQILDITVPKGTTINALTFGG
jgi:cytochrome c biogenesis protein CcdA/thiol-disulfide isomerase/thioredoxin